jgi:hypothetical protein
VNGWTILKRFRMVEPCTKSLRPGTARQGAVSGPELCTVAYPPHGRQATCHLSFSDRELDDLRPGTVLVPETEGDANKTESLADFKTKSCEDW